LAKNVIIIEAPGKVSKFKKAVGKGWEVYPTVGHCVDLPVKKLGVDIKKDFEPTWEVKDDSEATIKTIQKACKNADNVYLMTDEDREGEAIAWHIYERIKGDCKGQIHRATTNAITKSGIDKALANPGSLNYQKINAYLARRLLDRLCGYKTSFLTQQATGGRSAGRVQSAVLRIIVDREKEILAFIPEEYWVLTAHLLTKKGEKYTGVLTEKIKVPNETEATKIYDACMKATPKIASVESKEVNINPYAPFTTLPMVSTAASVFGWPAEKTMSVAQSLYTAGLCVMPDDIIVTQNGMLVEMQDVPKLVSDLPIVGLDQFETFADTTTYNSCDSFVEEAQKIRYKGIIHSFRTMDGQEISATPDHKFLIFKNNKIRWELSDHIHDGDFMLCAKNMKIDRGSSIPHIFFLISQLPEDVLEKIRITFSGNHDVIDSIIESHRDEIASATYYKYKRLHKIPIKWFMSLIFDAKEIYRVHLGYSCLSYIDSFQMGGQPECFSTEDFCYFLGLYLGDGHSSDSKITFPRCIMTTKQWKTLLISLGKDYSFGSDKSINVSGPILKNLCEHFGGAPGYKADKIFIHPFISSMPRHVVMRFMAGLWDSDGCINIKHRLTMSYTTISQKMAKQINVLLRSLGFQSGIHRRKSDGKNCSIKILRQSGKAFLQEVLPHLLVKQSYCKSLLETLTDIGQPQNFNFPVVEIIEQIRDEKGWTKQQLSEFVFGNSSDYWNYLRILPGRNRPSYIPPHILKKIGLALESQMLINLANGDVYFTPVKNVKTHDYDGYVYDITTSTENFICNTFVSHNCTYHRTDSPFMDPAAVTEIRDFVGHKYGSDYQPTKAYVYAAKAGAQEAHECCRPTNILETPSGLDADQKKLYGMIWKRAIGSQMTPAKDRRIKVITDIAGYDFVTNGKVELFDGFRKVWTYSSAEDVVLPELKKGEETVLKALEKEQKFTSPPPRYTDSSLAKFCEKKQITRPATIANVFKTLKDRNYVTKKKNTFYPTDTGIAVVDFLTAADMCFVDVEFTAQMEELLDEIQSGSKDNKAVLAEFWDRLKKDIENGKKIKDANQKSEYTCPKCGGALLKKHSKFGAFFSCEHWKKKKDDDGNETDGCSYTANVGDHGEPVEKVAKVKEYADFKCKKCGSKMVKRSSKYGEFFGCEKFPQCRATADTEGNFKEPSKKKWKKKEG